MLNIPTNQTSPKNMTERKQLDVTLGTELHLFQERLKMELPNVTLIPAAPTAPLNVFPMSQKYCPYANLPYGKIGTIAEAGCGPLALEYAFRANGFNVDFKQLVDEVVNKGYRAYIYDSQGKITDGSGTEYALFDNVFDKLVSIHQITQLLKEGVSISILVQNSVYHEDPKRKGNHFVTMIGIDEENNAIIMDGNLITDSNTPQQALVKKPFYRLASGLKAAWAWNKNKLRSFVE